MNLSNSNNYDGGGTMLLPQNLPVRVIYTRTKCSPFHHLLANAPPLSPSSSSPSLLGVGSSSTTKSKTTWRVSSSAGSIYFFSNRVAHPRVYRSRHLGYVGAGLAILKMAVGDSGGYTSGGAKGLGGGAKTRESENRSGFCWSTAGRVGGYGHASASSRTG